MTSVLMIVGSVKGSPGVTTLTVTLAARWPQPAAPLVVELDPAGGDLGSRWQLHDEPGLRSMVASARHRLAGPTEWSQRLALGVDVVPAPADGGASTTVATFAETGPKLLQELAQRRPVLVDVGRWDLASPAAPVFDVADQVLLVARPELEDIRHVHAALPQVRDRCPAVQVVLSGKGRYRRTEIAEFLGVAVIAVIGHDPVSADVVAGRRRPAKGWSRRHLPTVARTLALTLAADPPAPPQTATEPDGVLATAEVTA